MSFFVYLFVRLSAAATLLAAVSDPVHTRARAHTHTHTYKGKKVNCILKKHSNLY